MNNMKTDYLTGLIVIFLLYIMFNYVATFYKKKSKKENFVIRKDERCSQPGQIFSDFQPGTVCLKPGFIKTI